MTVKQTSRRITQKMGELERALLPKLKQFYNQKIKNSQKSLRSCNLRLAMKKEIELKEDAYR